MIGIVHSGTQPTIESNLAVAVQIEERDGLARTREPVWISIPCPPGIILDAIAHVFDERRNLKQSQCRVLSRWPDGSIRWLLTCVDVSLRPNQRVQYRVQLLPNDNSCLQHDIPVQRSGDTVSLEALNVRFRFEPGSAQLFVATVLEKAGRTRESHVSLRYADRNQSARIVFHDIYVEEDGPVMASVVAQGTLGNLRRFSCRCGVFKESGRVSVEVTMHNPARARHRAGYWDLGDPASLMIRELSLDIQTELSDHSKVSWSAGPYDQWHTSLQSQFQIYQGSSGGQNWRSRVHLNRDRKISAEISGYRGECSRSHFVGDRASPVVSIRDEHSQLSASLTDFWQRFPSAIKVKGNHVALRMLPEQERGGHELQPGERYSRTAWLHWSAPMENASECLAWTHSPLKVQIDPQWTIGSRAFPAFPLSNAPKRPEYVQLLKDALSGPNNFFEKRELIDEYGWRHFGDVWADHEDALFKTTNPIVSHDNNQYDLLHGFLIQYLVTGDVRWRKLADPLAQHTIDIDIYHTKYDKSAYSGGMFWHTAHYHDADISTHRSYARSMRGKAIAAPGGGPSNEHQYTTGLLLYYFITGDLRMRDAVVQMADWVIAIDDGSKNLLGLFCDHPTGHASSTRDPDFHGPGRGAGNSIDTLLNGWLVTDNDRYLGKVKEIIRRTIHPCDDIEALRLLDVENRWSYTVHLQALARFIEITAQQPRLQKCRRFARQSLLHYARWMLDHERQYLADPDQLEYPTETWAAQDLRKGNVLLHAATLASTEMESRAFQKRGAEILDEAWERLIFFPTRDCTRPLSIVLQQAPIECFLRDRLRKPLEAWNDDENWTTSPHRSFVSQKQYVRSAMRSPSGILQMAFHMTNPQRIGQAAKRTWLAQRIRSWKSK